MKSLFVVVVLAVLSASNEAAVLQNEAVHVQNESVDVENGVVDILNEGVDVQSGVVEVQNGEADVQRAVSRANLNHGFVGALDTLLHRNYYYVAALPNAVQYQEITYQGDTQTRITAIRATEVGESQWAIPSVRSGGVGRNFATLRLTTSWGRGFYYVVEIWGRV